MNSRIEQRRVDEIQLNPDWPYRKQLGFIDGLVESMAKDTGLLQPIGVSTDGFLVWGRRRLEAARKLEWETIACLVVDMDEPLVAMKEENENRLPISASELTALMRAIEANERAKAKARQTAGLKQSTVKELVPEREKHEEFEDFGQTRDKIGEALGVSGKTVDALKKIDEHADEEIKAAVDAGEVTITDAAKVADKPPEVQKKALKAKRQGKAQTVSGAAKQIEDQRPDKQEPVKDTAGVPVPEKALPAFEAAKEISAICRDLDKVIARIEAAGKSDGGNMLHTTSQIQTLQNVRKSIWQGRPTHVCPYCRGEKKTCDGCGARGWTTKTVYDQAPENVRNGK